jgi:hypothetical protein
LDILEERASNGTILPSNGKRKRKDSGDDVRYLAFVTLFQRLQRKSKTGFVRVSHFGQEYIKLHRQSMDKECGKDTKFKFKSFLVEAQRSINFHVDREKAKYGGYCVRLENLMQPWWAEVKMSLPTFKQQLDRLRHLREGDPPARYFYSLLNVLLDRRGKWIQHSELMQRVLRRDPDAVRRSGSLTLAGLVGLAKTICNVEVGAKDSEKKRQQTLYRLADCSRPFKDEEQNSVFMAQREAEREKSQ